MRNVINALCMIGFLMSCILFNGFELIGFKVIGCVLVVAFGLGLIVNNLEEEEK